MTASEFGHPSVVRVLLQAGATVNTTSQVRVCCKLLECMCSVHTHPSLFLQFPVNFMLIEPITCWCCMVPHCICDTLSLTMPNTNILIATFSIFSGFSVGCCINREEGYLLPIWVRKTTLPTFQLNAPVVIRAKVNWSAKMFLFIARHYRGYTSLEIKCRWGLLLHPCLLITVVQQPGTSSPPSNCDEEAGREEQSSLTFDLQWRVSSVVHGYK